MISYLYLKITNQWFSTLCYGEYRELLINMLHSLLNMSIYSHMINIYYLRDGYSLRPGLTGQGPSDRF